MLYIYFLSTGKDDVYCLTVFCEDIENLGGFHLAEARLFNLTLLLRAQPIVYMLGVSSNVRSGICRNTCFDRSHEFTSNSHCPVEKGWKVRVQCKGATFLVEALKYALSFEALARIWRNKGVEYNSTTIDEVKVYPVPAALYFIKNLCHIGFLFPLSEIQWAAFILLCAGCTTAQLNTNGIAVSMVMKYADNIVKGQPYDINADMAAGKLAVALCAEKLILEYWRTVMIPRAC
ncbi:unnamed protein product [Fraxinus pennsylvanica]|uniref:Uncharacterized protein n=1 Tax=Fraxinus pennsylvanica TaxID=56036 RepID=A0AAD1YLZ9_9LAMI|nr:unnamed protein product [Fraxinus pennsylvanica]